MSVYAPPRTKICLLGGDHAAVFSLERVRPLLEEPIRGLTFADLQRPCAVVAVDINHGEEVIIRPMVGKVPLLDSQALPGSEAAGMAATISVLPQIKGLLKSPKRKFLW